MFTRRSTGIAAVAALTLMAMQAVATMPAFAAPVLHDGRYYEVIIHNGVTWEAAKAAAELRTYNGIGGHLATIGSPEEDAHIHALRQQTLAAPHPPLTGTELWVGGYQLPCVTGTPEPGCGWMWINGESIAPTNSASPYTNWQSGEPNNLTSSNASGENHLAIGKSGVFGWNDEGNLSNVWGYVVEYGDKVAVPATTCTAGAGGCNPTGAQVFSYPASATVQPDATLTARTYLIHDLPGRCGNTTLPLFNGAVVIPKYLCGHPDFIVIETLDTGVSVPSGTILVENQTEDVLPGNLYGCTAIRQTPDVGEVPPQTDPDPSHRDVVAWQSSDKTQMLETTLGTGRFAGTLAEVTYGCGSSRGKVLRGSYHFVGLRIHPGAGNDYAANTLGNHQSFVDLTAYKLKLLQASVVASKSSLSKGSYVLLKALADTTVKLHKLRAYKAALVTIKLFQRAAEGVSYQPVAGKNFNGEHLMRASNIQYMYTDKLIPFAP